MATKPSSSQVSFTATGSITATDLQAALAEVSADASAEVTAAVAASNSSLATSAGAAMVGYMPSGVGAVATTVQGKLRESVSVKDFLPQSHVIDGSVDYSAQVTAALISIPPARISLVGANGSFGPVFDDALGSPLTLGAGFTLTLDQMLKAQDGETVLVTATGAVTSAATAFEQGFFTGQKLTLVTDQTGNTITIQHSVQVQNNSAASVVLGTAKRSATWVYNSAVGRWYQLA